jgi:hypothetical protein
MRTARPSGWFIAGCLFAVYIIWGTTYLAIKIGIEGARSTHRAGRCGSARVDTLTDSHG